ncbi:MAG: amidophosphoribosyltransferase [Pseudomonadota bacterium]
MSDDDVIFDDSLHEECGVFGIYAHEDAGKLTALGLHALQHRGQEAAGIVTCDGRHFVSERRMGLVGDKFTRQDVIERLKGHAAVGHVRYSTSGETINRNIQPLFADLASGGIAVSHNGNLTNAASLRKQLISDGAIFQSTTDTESILHLIAQSKSSLSNYQRVINALRQVKGAFSFLALSEEGLIGVRDPYGVRPLVLGRLMQKDGGQSYVLASETCALDIINAEFIRDIDAGEAVSITKDGIKSERPFEDAQKRFCIFEYVYFARPDSTLEGLSIYEARKNIGSELAKEAPADADLIVPVPDSGNPAAMGFAQASFIPFELGIIRNHYVGRTFIEPTQQIRDLGVKLKHSANKRIVQGKRIVLVDDSIVRGTTSRKIVEMMREAGALEIHMRIASPPTAWPCFYGVDTPERNKLLAANMKIDEMAKFIGADSLAFISVDGLYRAMYEEKRNDAAPQFCDACFTGDYPIELVDAQDSQLSKISTLFQQNQNS